MSNGTQSPLENLEYKITFRLMERLFAMCSNLPESDQHVIYREMGKRLLEQIPVAPIEKPKQIEVLGIQINQS